MKKDAALTALWTGLLFVVVYNACNWLTHVRPDVQVCAWPWEQSIPVIEWMIVPYWSLDAFFIAAPFLCKTPEELVVLRKRLVTATLFAGLCYLAIPLTMAWDRPHVEGLFGPWFRAIQGFDQPHNLFPSLHIAYRTLLAAHYARHTQGWMKGAMHGWFSLIGLSTLFTWQHHVIDVAGGFVLAAVCFRCLPDRQRVAEGNPKIAWMYGAGALGFLALVPVALPWTLVFYWVAAALAVVTSAYLGTGAAITRKQNGQLPWDSRLLLAPWLFGQWLSLNWYRRQSAAWDELASGVWMGALPTEATARRAIEAGVTHVLDVTTEFTEAEPFRKLPHYLNLPVQDLTAPSQDQLRQGAQWIEAARAGGGTVFIHCKAGYSRTAAMAGAWLLLTGRAGSVDEAAQMMKDARPGMIVRLEVRAALQRFAQERGAEIKRPA